MSSMTLDRPRRKRRPVDVVEDVEWLLSAGETHPHAIAARLGYRSHESLVKALRKAGRHDLVDRLDPARLN